MCSRLYCDQPDECRSTQVLVGVLRQSVVCYSTNLTHCLIQSRMPEFKIVSLVGLFHLLSMLNGAQNTQVKWCPQYTCETVSRTDMWNCAQNTHVKRCHQYLKESILTDKCMDLITGEACSIVSHTLLSQAVSGKLLHQTLDVCLWG